MTRCQHCNKLTHCEHLVVYYAPNEHGKVSELTDSVNWLFLFQYPGNDPYLHHNEYGRLKCGDIYIHFRVQPPEKTKSKAPKKIKYKPSKEEYTQESARDDAADYGPEGKPKKLAVIKLGPKKKLN